MSCNTGQNKAAQTATANGISESSSRNGYVAGSTSQAAAFASSGQKKPDGTRSKPKNKAAPPEKKPTTAKKQSAAKENSTAKTRSTKSKHKMAKPTNTRKKPGAQASFFETYQAGHRDLEPLPNQRQIRISRVFTTDELQTISIQLRLGAAAVSRHIRELDSGAQRGIGYGDPRPLDWAKLDQQNFQFLVEQVAKARHNGRYIDTSSLKKEELFDLWEFSKFEADRAHRNIDHLRSGGSHITGPTAAYLAERHQLDARFYTFVANQLEPMMTPEIISDYLLSV